MPAENWDKGWRHRLVSLVSTKQSMGISAATSHKRSLVDMLATRFKQWPANHKEAMLCRLGHELIFANGATIHPQSDFSDLSWCALCSKAYAVLRHGIGRGSINANDVHNRRIRPKAPDAPQSWERLYSSLRPSTSTTPISLCMSLCKATNPQLDILSPRSIRCHA